MDNAILYAKKLLELDSRQHKEKGIKHLGSSSHFNLAELFYAFIQAKTGTIDEKLKLKVPIGFVNGLRLGFTHDGGNPYILVDFTVYRINSLDWRPGSRSQLMSAKDLYFLLSYPDGHNLASEQSDFQAGLVELIMKYNSDLMPDK